MYINFNKLHSIGFEIQHLLLLVAIKQKEELELYYDEDVIEEWLENGLIKKLKKGELRIDTKGELLLKNLSSVGSISEDTSKIVEWLIKVYKSRPGGIIKNKKETERRCQWFTEQTGIEKNQLGLLLKCFMSDSYDESSGMTITEAKQNNPRLVISNMLDAVFWKPPNNFARHYTLDDSPLWRYYEDNIEWVKGVWSRSGA